VIEAMTELVGEAEEDLMTVNKLLIIYMIQDFNRGEDGNRGSDRSSERGGWRGKRR
jgi:hypothetical protein